MENDKKALKDLKDHLVNMIELAMEDLSEKVAKDVLDAIDTVESYVDETFDNIEKLNPVDENPVLEGDEQEEDEQEDAKVDPWPKPFFGGAAAPWAVPKAFMKTHHLDAMKVNEFKAMCSGRINCNTHNWAICKHIADGNTPKIKLQVERPEWCNLRTGHLIPWDKSWRHGQSADRYSIVVMRSGVCYLIWGTTYDAKNNVMRCKTANIVVKNGLAGVGNSEANIWKKTNGFLPSRAAGIALPHMLVTREEMEAGKINHCLALALPMPSRKKVAPATKVIGVMGTDENNRLGTGYRIQYDLTRQEIDAWANSMHPDFVPHARTIGNAVRDYGFIVVDHGGSRERKIGSVYFEHDATAKWEEIGVGNRAMRCLHTLLPKYSDRVWFARPPEFINGDPKRTAIYPWITEYPEIEEI